MRPASKMPIVLSTCALAAIFIATQSAAQAVHFLHSFTANGHDGVNPWSGLVFDSAGNLYGTTYHGGTYNYGAVFKLSPQTGGGWTEETIHSFNLDGIDGFYPEAGVILDSAGNLYGTTTQGGNGGCTYFGKGTGCGIVFKLIPSTHGYQERILYNFKNINDDGNFPVGNLIFDASGNMYGTTEGGVLNSGTVFELFHTASGIAEKILWRFDQTNGSSPRAGLVLDAAGNLYGTTQSGGSKNFGTVFELSPSSNGTWIESVLHSFNLNSTDVAYPAANLIFDSAGNLYGTASYGNQSGGGGVFELSPSSNGTWNETILHDFNDTAGSDGYNSQSHLIFDASGNLYGVTSTGGTGQCEQIGVVIGCGTIFKLNPALDSSWTETVVYNFNFNSDNNPEGPVGGGLISDAAGNFYGATYGGGASSNGAVFVFKP